MSTIHVTFCVPSPISQRCALQLNSHTMDLVAHSIVQPGGHLILSTISRTPLANLLTIRLAENPLFGFVSPGTHSYAKYLKPNELTQFFNREMLWSDRTRIDMETRGVIYHPLKGDWVLSSPSDSPVRTQLCNYFFGARKPLS